MRSTLTRRSRWIVVAVIGLFLGAMASFSAAQTPTITIIQPSNGHITAYIQPPMANGAAPPILPYLTCPSFCIKSPPNGGLTLYVFAIPAPGYKLRAWGGACNGWPTDPTVGPTFGVCTVVVHTTTVSATFVPLNPLVQARGTVERQKK